MGKEDNLLACLSGEVKHALSGNGGVFNLDEMAKQLFVQFAHLSCLALNARSRPSSTITRCYYEKNAPTSAIILCLLSDF